MVDLLDFRLSPKMHIKKKFSWDSLQNIMKCVRASRNFYCAIFMSVALIVVEIHAFLHCILLLLILFKF